MFRDVSHLLEQNPPGRYYGVAVADVDGDGAYEFLVAGFGCPNRVLKWRGGMLRELAIPELQDAERATLGLAAGDLDGDGREELYFLNSDTFAGTKHQADRLWKARADGSWDDLFSHPENQAIRNLSAGRSVATIDRRGIGRYGFVVANYARPLRLYELGPASTLVDLAPTLDIAAVTGGRGLLTAPIFGPHTDIVCVNENGPNFAFHNQGDGTFEECAVPLRLDDASEHGRGVTALDADGDGQLDLAWANWEGPHRLMLRQADGTFRDRATPGFAFPSPARTLLAADFDNDGQEELFLNNFGEPNRLYRVCRQSDPCLALIDCGAALEPHGLGTGAAYADIDGDGVLELLVAHGEADRQRLALYKANILTPRHWLRVLPLTRFGAPARGSAVRLQLNGQVLTRCVDAGSGYLCQMEPIAHFGLGSSPQLGSLHIIWPDGTTLIMDDPGVDRLLVIPFPNG